jgi:UDP-glucose 4-epimerase
VRVVVTGGAGFIGANLCRRLALESNIAEVVAFDDLSTGSRQNLEGVDPKIKLVVATLLDRDAVDATVDDADAIVHLAARPSVPRSLADPVATHQVNVDGTVNVLEAARGLSTAPRFVFASSSSVYGANPTMPKTEDLVAQPRSPVRRQQAER